MFNNPFAINFIFGNDFQQNREIKVYRPRRNSEQISSYQFFRFSDDSVNFLTNEFLIDHDDLIDDENLIQTETRGGALDRKMKMKIFLRSVSDPGFQVCSW